MLERTVSFFEIRRSHIVHLLEEWTRSDNRLEIEKQPKKLTRTYLCKAQRFVKAFARVNRWIKGKTNDINTTKRYW